MFSRFLILPSIGMYVFTNHRTTPITISTRTIVTNETDNNGNISLSLK